MNHACLVPSLIPDLWYLAAVMNANRTVFLKDEAFSRKSQFHRILLRNAQGTQWFTMPVHPDDRKKPLSEVRIDNVNWQKELMKVLRTNYGNSIFYDFYEPEIEADLQAAAVSGLMYDAVLTLNKRIFRYLEIGELMEAKTSHITTAEFSRSLEKSVDQDEIWIEPRGSYYRKIVDTKGAVIKSPNFSLPEYRQHFNGFHPGCCLLDLLFQKGPASFEVIDKLKA